MPDAALLPRTFYSRPVQVVARELLGKLCAMRCDSGMVTVRIVETEAYQSDIDQASHAYRGRTCRNAPMFGPPAHLYVYRCYGLHHCMNVVPTHDGGPASAVLIRSMEALEGQQTLVERRGVHNPWALLRGPGNVCRALGIDLAYSGRDLMLGNPSFLDGPPPPEPVMVTTRIGISRSQDFPWRFYLIGNAAVSRRDRRAEESAERS